jgi:hypothetical protein
MSLIIDYAFKHLASGNPEPFDFGQCRQQIMIPDTTETHFSEFLGHCLKDNMERKFEETAAVLAASLLRNSLSAEGKGECSSLPNFPQGRMSRTNSLDF